MFFCIVVPALIIGVTGLRTELVLRSHPGAAQQSAGSASRVKAIQQQEVRAFRVLLKVIVALLVLVFGIFPLITALILAFVE